MQIDIQDVLKERGSRYGKFTTHAQITQEIKQIILKGPSVPLMQADQVECLEMIAHKIGRILNGDPNYEDSWRDIAGYATLVADRLIGKVV